MLGIIFIPPWLRRSISRCPFSIFLISFFRKKTCLIFLIGTALIFCLSFSFVFAQSYLVHTYRSEPGLLSPEIHDFVQDDYGRLWIATRGGITVYDGFHWEAFTVSNGLPGNAVAALAKDEKGRIWALVEFPNPGLCYYENNVWKIVPLEGIIETTVKFTQLRVSLWQNDLRLAIGTKNHGLYYLSQGQWSRFNATQRLGVIKFVALNFFRESFS